MKKLIYKIHSWLYEHHRAKMLKYFHKMIGAKRYQSVKLSKAEKDYMKADLNALYGLSCYADTDSFKKASDAEDKEWGTPEERGII